jgi:alkanesulfonate monooxygenase SsuD/methylene tetrahydromethanopterin reductase-like flavin-dependent oxidoreductase (luciferase family)
VRVSVYLPNWTNGARWGEQPTWPEMAEIARSLDGMGADGIWVADQMRQTFDANEPLDFWEAFTLLGAVAGVTQRATIGPLVASAGFRNPAL